VHSISEHFGALAELRDAGLIRHLGISGVEAAHLAEAQAIAPVVCVQNAYSVGDRRPESRALLQACGEQDIAFVPFFAIAGTRRHGVTGHGGDSGRADNADPGQLSDIARAHDATVAQIRLSWTLHQGPHVLAIPGTGNPDHLLENVAAGTIELSSDELASLAEVSR
jgi:aryl-alcohol dehydrogenase-like predicted oxidoreductase